MPDSSRFGLTVGTGFHVKNTVIDAGYNPIFLKKRTINNNQENGLYSQDGEFKTVIHVFSLSVTQKWGGIKS